MLHLTIHSASDSTESIMGILRHEPAVSALAVVPRASVQPPGDLIFADVAREAANNVIDRLRAAGVQEGGTLHIDPVHAWVSRAGYDAEQAAPGSSADAVVWPEVVQHAYEDSELNWTFLSFMTLATLLAAIAIVLDSDILVIGAMVLGPEFGAIAALGVALVRRRSTLFRLASRTLFWGFAAAIAVTTTVGLLWRSVGWITRDDITGPRPQTGFIYTPDKWTFLVALIAAAAGVLSLTSAKVGGLSGVFISVCTVPASGNIALGLAFGVMHEVWGSLVQLMINITGMALAGWVTLALQRHVWARVAIRGSREAGLARDDPTKGEG
jgi:uncharacterized hydrophobic protein (TIGR00271 family)